MATDGGPYGYTACVVCDDVTHNAAGPPLCRGCHWLMARGCMRPAHVARAVKDALAALMGYRVRLGVLGPPTTACRQRWCLDYCRARGDYLRAHNGTLPPVVPVPHTTQEWLRRTEKVRRLRTHSPGTTPAPGP